MEAWGNLGGDEGPSVSPESSIVIKTASEEDPVFITAGKDFGLVRTTGGKVLINHILNLENILQVFFYRFCTVVKEAVSD